MNNLTTPEEIQKLRALADAAKPGPYVSEQTTDNTMPTRLIPLQQVEDHAKGGPAPEGFVGIQQAIHESAGEWWMMILQDISDGTFWRTCYSYTPDWGFDNWDAPPNDPHNVYFVEVVPVPSVTYEVKK